MSNTQLLGPTQKVKVPDLKSLTLLGNYTHIRRLEARLQECNIDKQAFINSNLKFFGLDGGEAGEKEQN